jgi:hypothetical protein
MTSYRIERTIGDASPAGIECVAGEDLQITLALYSSSGVPLDITDGRVELGLSKRGVVVDSKVSVATTPVNEATSIWTPSETIALAAGPFLWDAFLIGEGNSRRDVIRQSRLTLLPATTPTIPWGTMYWGVGAPGLNAAALAELTHEYVTTPARTTVLSPDGEACYWVVPATMPEIAVYLSGFPVPMLAARTETVDGVACGVYETESSANTATSASFEVRIS